MHRKTLFPLLLRVSFATSRTPFHIRYVPIQRWPPSACRYRTGSRARGGRVQDSNVVQPHEGYRQLIGLAYFALHSSSPFRPPPPPRIHSNMKRPRSPRRKRCTQEIGIKGSARASGTAEARRRSFLEDATFCLRGSGRARPLELRPSATTDATSNEPPRAATGGGQHHRRWS